MELLLKPQLEDLPLELGPRQMRKVNPKARTRTLDWSAFLRHNPMRILRHLLWMVQQVPMLVDQRPLSPRLDTKEDKVVDMVEIITMMVIINMAMDNMADLKEEVVWLEDSWEEFSGVEED